MSEEAMAGAASALTVELGGRVPIALAIRCRDKNYHGRWLPWRLCALQLWCGETMAQRSLEDWPADEKELVRLYELTPKKADGEVDRLRALLRRGMRQLEAWQEFYGRHCNGSTMGNVLPPAGDVQWTEDVSEALKTPNSM